MRVNTQEFGRTCNHININVLSHLESVEADFFANS